jgi:hypothetical protein
MILLIEQASPVQTDLVGKKLYLESIFVMAGKKNANSRIYPVDVASRAIERIEPRIREGSMFGTTGHGSSSTVEPSQVSHIVQSLKRKGDNWIGRARIIDSGQGSVLRSIIDAGGKIGISSRATGNVKKVEEDLWEVQEPLHIHSFDAVVRPSTQHLADAIYESILNEASAEAHKGDKLSKDSLTSRADEIAASIVARLAALHPEIASAQARNALSFDTDIMPAQSPTNYSETVLQIAERDRAKIVAALLKIADELSAQNDSGSERDKVGAYAKWLNQYSSRLTRDTSRDPFAAAALRREQVRQQAGKLLIERAVRLLSRTSNLSTSTPNTLVDSVRAKSGSRRDSTQNEIDAINEYNKRSRK